MNNDIKTKKQQIEQYAQQIEQLINEKTQQENEHSDLQRQVSWYFIHFHNNKKILFELVSC